MFPDHQQVFCERSWQRNRIDLFLQAVHPEAGPGGARFIGKPVEMTLLGEDAELMQPTMALGLKAAQQLMDELWRCGIRPSEGQGSAGALAATQDHLKDMQRIAFALLRDEQAVADTMRARSVSVMEVRS